VDLLVIALPADRVNAVVVAAVGVRGMVVLGSGFARGRTGGPGAPA
jgi:hypothetical protein